MEAVVVHDFHATKDDEMSLKKGSIVKALVDEIDDSPTWYKGEQEGREGWVPTNYIKLKPFNNWFYGKTSRDASEKLLLESKLDGTFLVRCSESTPGDYTLSVLFGASVQHFKILRDGAGKYFLWVVKFKSINELIEYHRTSSVSRSQAIYLVKGMGAIVSEKEVFEFMYDFEPKEEGELLARKGDKVEILDKPDANWWNGRLLANGSCGLFPMSYVKPKDQAN